MRTELLQYNIAYDRKEKDAGFIAKHLETHLRERFNVLVSTAEYGIQNGHLVRQGTKEPFINSIKKGRDIIQFLSSDKVDVERENAEVLGFAKIDSFLCDPTTPLGSKMLSISPKGDEGSKYQHNFYDIFALKEVQGERYVELSRFSSALKHRDYAKYFGLDCNNPPNAADFLSNPIKKDARVTTEQIHKALHREHEYMSPSTFTAIWTSPLVQFYVKRYEANRDARSFNAVLNAADKALGNKDYSSYTPSHSEIRFLEEKKVRQAGGQCPGKSGADLDASPFSVSEFAEPDKYGDRTFECPECGKTNVRPRNKLLRNCQHCGSNKVAC